MADDSTDIANEEELVIFFCTKYKKTDSICKSNFRWIHRMGLNIENARGQCYEGAATLSGTKGGVTTKIKSLNEIASEMLKY